MMDRRSFLSLAAASLLVESTRGMTLPAPLAGRLGGDPLLLGVASGDPAPDGFVLWTRLSTDTKRGDGGLAPEPVGVRWEVASDPGMRHIVRRGRTSAPDGAVHAEFAPQELRENPHIAYENDLRGYFVCDVTPGAMVSELRTVDAVTTRDGTVTATARFRTEAGRPGVQLA